MQCLMGRAATQEARHQKLCWHRHQEGSDQTRQNVTGGTAGPIMSPMTRNSQLRSMPAALNMQDRAPVMHANDESNSSQCSLCGNHSGYRLESHCIIQRRQTYP